MTVERLADLLRYTAQKHHEYETEVLKHKDDDWYTWYATFILSLLPRDSFV